MTGSNPDPRTPEDDLDPTGVRALLANLPDPGPMPDELVQRISQSLELEQERRVSSGSVAWSGDPDHGTTAPGADSSSGRGGNVVSLTTERRRRRPGRTVLWLGGAAAVAMIATVSVNQLIGDDTPSDTGVAAHVPSTQDSGESDAAQNESAEEDAESGHDDAANPGHAPDDDAPGGPSDGLAEPPPLSNDGGDVSSSTQIYAVAGTVELTSSDWDDEVTSWLSTTLAREESTWGATQVSECLATGGLDTGQATRVVLSEAVWAQEPATLVVAEASSGDTAWVLTSDCDAVLSGPTPLD